MSRARHASRAGAATALAVILALGLVIAPATRAVAATPQPRASFTDVQAQLMCIACHEPLAVARSPEAFSENAYVRQLIRQGETKPQILHTMATQYGVAVLAKPPARGFSLLVYVIPGAVVLIGLAILGVTIPRWRRRSRAQATAAATRAETATALSADDAARLDADLARHA